jgi:hypothetical protein
MRFFTNFHASLASSRAFYRASHDFGKLPRILPASVRHRLIAHALRLPTNFSCARATLFRIFFAHRTKPPLLKPSDSRRFVVFLMTLCRRFDDAPIVARPASIMKTSAKN